MKHINNFIKILSSIICSQNLYEYVQIDVKKKYKHFKNEITRKMLVYFS